MTQIEISHKRLLEKKLVSTKMINETELAKNQTEAIKQFQQSLVAEILPSRLVHSLEGMQLKVNTVTLLKEDATEQNQQSYTLTSTVKFGLQKKTETHALQLTSKIVLLQGAAPSCTHTINTKKLPKYVGFFYSSLTQCNTAVGDSDKLIILKNLLAVYAEDQDKLQKSINNYNLVANALPYSEQSDFKEKLQSALKKDHKLNSPQHVINEIVSQYTEQARDTVHFNATLFTCLSAGLALLTLTALIMGILLAVGAFGAEYAVLAIPVLIDVFPLFACLTFMTTVSSANAFDKKREIRDMQTAQVSDSSHPVEIELPLVALTSQSFVQEGNVHLSSVSTSLDTEGGDSLGREAAADCGL